MLSFLECKCRKLVLDFWDCERKLASHFDRWRSRFVFALFFGLEINWCVFAVPITEGEEATICECESGMLGVALTSCHPDPLCYQLLCRSLDVQKALRPMVDSLSLIRAE